MADPRIGGVSPAPSPRSFDYSQPAQNGHQTPAEDAEIKDHSSDDDAQSATHSRQGSAESPRKPKAEIPALLFESAVGPQKGEGKKGTEDQKLSPKVRQSSKQSKVSGSSRAYLAKLGQSKVRHTEVPKLSGERGQPQPTRHLAPTIPAPSQSRAEAEASEQDELKGRKRSSSKDAIETDEIGERKSSSRKLAGLATLGKFFGSKSRKSNGESDGESTESATGPSRRSSGSSAGSSTEEVRTNGGSIAPSLLASAKSSKHSDRRFLTALATSTTRATVAVPTPPPLGMEDLFNCLIHGIPPLFFIGYIKSLQEKIAAIKTVSDEIVGLTEQIQALKSFQQVFRLLTDEEMGYVKQRRELSKDGLREITKDILALRHDEAIIQQCLICKSVEEMLPWLAEAKHKLLSKVTETISRNGKVDCAHALLSGHLKFIQNILKGCTCKEENDKLTKLLLYEIEQLQVCLKLPNMKEIHQYIDGTNKSLETTVRDKEINQRTLQDDLKRFWRSEHVQKKAFSYLRRGTLPKLGENAAKMLLHDCILVEVASQALALMRLDGTPNDAVAIKDGSGGVYLVTDQKRKPLLVVKPVKEAPGMSDNTKDQTPEALQVFGQRSLDPTRLGFPVSEGFLREMAVSIALPKTVRQRSFASLKLAADSPEQKFSLLIPYEEHLYHLANFVDAVKEQIWLAELVEIKRGLEALENVEGNVEGDDTVKKRGRLNAQKDRATSALGGLNVKPDKTAEQKEAIQCCSEWRKIDIEMKYSKLPIWSLIDASSLDRLVDYMGYIPDLDRNLGNLLLRKRSGGGDKPYEILLIDFEQSFPDTWQSPNLPQFLGSEAFDFVLADHAWLAERIKSYDARSLLAKLRKHGIQFQEAAKVIHSLEEQKDIVVGGQVFNILNAFHLTAKIGLANRNTVNQVWRILFGSAKIEEATSLLHELFIQAKDLAERGAPPSPSKEYKELCETELYREICGEEKNGEGTMWGHFERLVLRELNKEKTKDEFSKAEKK